MDLSELTPYTSNSDVERILIKNGFRLYPSVGGKPYAVDCHYETFVLLSINTVDDALKMCEKLESECPNCTKAHQIRSWLKKEFWTKTPSRIRSAISANRRVCCQNHERYSFAVRER